MPPQLKFDGIRSLLDQSLQYTPCNGFCSRGFGKILGVNHAFVNTARKYQSYRFVMFFCSNSVEFSFKSFNNVKINAVLLSFEKARRAVLLLDPPVFEIKGFLYAGRVVAQFYDLVLLPTGKIWIEAFFGEKLPDYVMQRINKLKCDVTCLYKLNLRPEMETLQVLYANSIDQLKAALKLSPKHLKFYLDSYSLGNNKDIIISGTEKFTLNVHFNISDPTILMLVIRKVLNMCPKLKKLKIKCRRYCSIENNNVIDEIARFINDEEFYKELNDGIRRLQPTQPNLRFCAAFGFIKHMFSPLLLLRESWLTELKSHAGLKNLSCSTTKKRSQQCFEMTSNSNKDLFKSKRYVRIFYNKIVVD